MMINPRKPITNEMTENNWKKSFAVEGGVYAPVTTAFLELKNDLYISSRGNKAKKKKMHTRSKKNVL